MPLDGLLNNILLLPELPLWLLAPTVIVTLASLVAALTPTPRDDKILGKLYKIIEVLALNLGHAKDRTGISRARRSIFPDDQDRDRPRT
jgi:hypothetical protein